MKCLNLIAFLATGLVFCSQNIDNCKSKNQACVCFNENKKGHCKQGPYTALDGTAEDGLHCECAE